jgi:uncharacterized membrane protein HdeD (DUF308 family)
MGEWVMDVRRSDLKAATSRWWMFLVLGVAAVVVGLILLFDLVAAVGTLAAFVAFGLIFTGLGELTAASRYRTVLSVAAGVLLIAAGVVALAWPDITLWALAVVTGIGLLLSGAVRLGAALGDKPDGWGWLMVGGILSLVVGIVALAWPGATVLVLALLLGFRLVVFGAVEIAFALGLRDLGRQLTPLGGQ